MEVATFDGPNKLMTIITGTTTIELKVLYSDWKEWCLKDDNLKYPQAFKYVGGEPTINGQYLGTTYFILNDWRIRPYDGEHTLIVNGNIFTEDGTSPFTKTATNKSVVIYNVFSNLLSTIDTGSTAYTPSQIANAVWNQDTSSGQFDNSTSIGYHIKNNVPDEIASSVWNKDVESPQFVNTTSIGYYIKNKVLSVSKFLRLT